MDEATIKEIIFRCSMHLAQVVDNDDPEKRGRVRVRLGNTYKESPWAWPEGGGEHRQGKLDVPAVGTTVRVWFEGGNLERLHYSRGPHADGEIFPEYTGPDTYVLGIGPFRLTVDKTPGVERLTLALVEEFDGVEETTAEIGLDAKTKALVVHGNIIALGGGLVTLQDLSVDKRFIGNTQINGRPVARANKPL